MPIFNYLQLQSPVCFIALAKEAIKVEKNCSLRQKMAALSLLFNIGNPGRIKNHLLMKSKKFFIFESESLCEEIFFFCNLQKSFLW